MAGQPTGEILETLIAHAMAECSADFDALMETISPDAHYHSYVSDEPASNEAQSPKGKDGIAASSANLPDTQ